MLARILAFCDFRDLKGHSQDMGQKSLTEKQRFAAKSPHQALNGSPAQFFGKADRSLLYAPGQHASLFQSK
jgi:hypothetical protein